MTNVLIRRLINCGYDPDRAQSICIVYIKDSSLSVLEEVISNIEEGWRNRDVDKIQPQPNREKCW